MTADAHQPGDQWAEWLLRGRQQGMNERELRAQQQRLGRIRDRTLRGARLRKGQQILDVGAGTGLLTLEACRRVGLEGFVCGLDVSHTALREAQRLAADRTGAATLAAVRGDALALPFADASFDAVLTRSVLIYLTDKTAAAREFFRVLRPGGRVSVFEPINRAGQKYGDYGGRDFGEQRPAHERVLAHQYAHWEHRSAMLDFDERDMVQWFVDAGFNVVLTYEHAEGLGQASSIGKPAARRERMAAALARRYNPSMLSYAEAAQAVLGSEAAQHLVHMVDRLLAEPERRAYGAAYLSATRPKH
ncbi:MAG: class I SAM-dependent methyltransferase [Dehalococcoidia bacterium]